MTTATRGNVGLGRWLYRGVALVLAGAALTVVAAFLRTSGTAVAAVPQLVDFTAANPLPEALAFTETAEIGAAIDRWRGAQWAGAMNEFARVRAARDAARDAVWDRMAQCETGGNWAMRGSRYSGGVGFMNAAWTEFGGREFAPNAGMATREQQIVVAERIRAAHGYSAWGCADSIGLG